MEFTDEAMEIFRRFHYKMPVKLLGEEESIAAPPGAPKKVRAPKMPKLVAPVVPEINVNPSEIIEQVEKPKRVRKAKISTGLKAEAAKKKKLAHAEAKEVAMFAKEKLRTAKALATEKRRAETAARKEAKAALVAHHVKVVESAKELLAKVKASSKEAVVAARDALKKARADLMAARRRKLSMF